MLTYHQMTLADMFFVNCLVLCTHVIVFSFMTRTMSIEQIQGLKGKVLIGLSCSTLGFFLLAYSWTLIIMPDVVLSFFIIACMIAVHMGRKTALAITTASIFLMQTNILQFKMGRQELMYFFLAVIFLVILSIVTDLYHIPETKQWAWIVLGETMIGICYIYLRIHTTVDHWGIIVIQWMVFFLIIAVIKYYLMRYLEHINKTFRRYKNESKNDFLTKLHTKSYFETTLKDIFGNREQYDAGISCIMFDLDHFKHINDTYGHENGDAVLCETAAILKESIREADLIGRVGGEEFCAVFKDCSLENAIHVADIIRRKIEKNMITLKDGRTIGVTISVGVSNYPESTSEYEKIKIFADEALYDAKKEGRNRVMPYKKR